MTLGRYDAVADFYEAGFSDVDPVLATLLDLLGPVDRLRVLDLACGHGRATRELARRGARVTGVDVSRALLDKAEAAERALPLGIRYTHGDAAGSHWLAAGSYDAVICSFALSDIDDLDGAVGAAAAALRPDGRFVFSILHPCFPGGGQVSGSWPSTGRYYDEGRWTPDGALTSLRRQVGACHRTLATYLNTMRQHGLCLDELREPEPSPDWANSGRRDAARFPVYLVAR